jgi:hypothetical protein
MPKPLRPSFQRATHDFRPKTGNFREAAGEMIPTVATVGAAETPASKPPAITSVSAKSTSPLPSNMYNLGAFDLEVVSSNPRSSVICLHYPASSGA